MTTKHTPGPWFAENGEGRWIVWDDAGMACICDVHTGVEPDPSGATHARLIAAAPDLLAALEDMLGHCRICDGKGRCYGHVPGNPGRHAPDQPCPDCGDARAAIAKAKGDKP